MINNIHKRERKEDKAKKRLIKAAENFVNKIPCITSFRTLVHVNGECYYISVEKLESD